MNVWIAVLFDKEFESYVRENAKSIGIKNNLDFIAFDLPQHISLKISFSCKETDFISITEHIENYFKGIVAFGVELDNIELIKGNSNIIWINIIENNFLRKMHDDFNKKMLEYFNIQLNEYDGKKFRFHSTLFIDNKNIDIKNYENAFIELKKLQFSGEQIINSACIGFSKTGKIGQYEIYKTFNFQ